MNIANSMSYNRNDSLIQSEKHKTDLVGGPDWRAPQPHLDRIGGPDWRVPQPHFEEVGGSGWRELNPIHSREEVGGSGWRELNPIHSREEVGGSGWRELNPIHSREEIGGSGLREINQILPVLAPDQQPIAGQTGGSKFLELAEIGASQRKQLGIEPSKTATPDTNPENGTTKLNYNEALETAKSNRGSIGWEKVTIEEGEGNPVEVWRFSEDKFASEFKKLPPGVGIIDTIPRPDTDIPEAGPADGEDGNPGDADGEADGDGGVGVGGAL